jgi:hypothetical protein
VPRGVYPRAPRKDLYEVPEPNKTDKPDDPRRKRGKKWSKARRAALSEKMRRKVGKHRLSPTLEAAVLVSKAHDLMVKRIRAGAPPDALYSLVLGAHLALTTVDE